MQTLKELLSYYNTDKDKYHAYGDIYHQYLTPKRDTATSILEIGVASGESLRVWRDFFPNAHVVGIDINPDAKVEELRISTHVGEQDDPRFLINVALRYGPFDFICDDGSHLINHQLQSLLYLWGFLKPTGVYAIEDIQDPDFVVTFERMGGKAYDLRHLRPNAPRDDILIIMNRHNMNYGFKCPEKGCLSRAHLNILMPMGGRPKCPKHQVHYVPDVNWPPNVKVEEITITPEDAEKLIEDAFPSSLEGVDERLVQNYAQLMKEGKWKFINREMGGEHYPIYFRDDRVLLGIQRLQACVISQVPLQTVAVRTYGYY